MPNYTAADTIRVLISTDNHVGYNERDSVRGNDSWRSFHEVMCLAKEHDVDMVLLAGDLFHENKPSRKSMYQVMRSLRMNCYGDKPCELEMLSDASEVFAGAFNHVNYEDPDINVAIPVFSIHGNHDDPAGEGEGHLAALDLLQMSGLLNYYGRTPESDNIQIKPVLLQKGNTKLALYGMSNVRDERLFRTFRDGGVKFFQPNTQKDDWFNLMSVHQNHHAHTNTGYLPESFLPSFMDLVVWGHEHECLIEPKKNPEKGFRVMQPGSSVATSLVQGESKEKKVAIISIKGKDFDIETIRLKTVRPFVYRDLILADDKTMNELSFRADDIRPKITRFLDEQVNEMIEEAREEWSRTHSQDDDEEEFPKPLIRLRVDYSAPEGGRFDIDNAQRFSNRFVERVANVNDVVQFHRKRQATRANRGNADMPEEDVLAAQMEMDAIKVGELVDDFLRAQNLTILPQNNFSDAVTQFVDKDDREAMTEFVDSALKVQVSHLVGGDEDDEIDEARVEEMMMAFRENLETAFEKGELKRKGRKKVRAPKPDQWDSDVEGPWEDNIASIVRDDEGEPIDDEEEEEVQPGKGKGSRGGRGGRGSRGGRGASRAGAAAAKKTATKAAPRRGKKKQQMFDEDDEDDDDDDDVIMTNGHDPIELDDDEEEDEDEELFVKPKKAPAKRAPAAAAKKVAPAKPRTTKAATGAQSQLGSFFGSSPANGNGSKAAAAAAKSKPLPKRNAEPSDDEISDDDAFEPPPKAAAATRGRGGRR
ncbi:meiotic recombination [Recurvomyces mirabilis]|nr:meiotic recombination [Recurvomyces mirabilis]